MLRVAAILFATSLLACAVPGECQTGRQVKVVLEFQQQGQDSRQGAQGRVSGVVVKDGKARGQDGKARGQDGKARGQDGQARGRAGVAVQDETTRTTRSEGIFTVVQDGGTASMLVASEVPVTVVGWFRDYATGQGYAAQGMAWQRVGTTLVVSPTILPNG